MTMEAFDIASTDALHIKPLGGRIGAILSGVQLNGDLGQAVADKIKSAMHKYKVVFFREQQGSERDLEAFAEKLGKPVAHPVEGASGGDYAYEMDSHKEFRSDHWHSDFSFQDSFVSVGILHPILLPESGGNTVWSNTAAAYESMPRELRAMLDQLWAVHGIAPVEATFPDAAEALKKEVAQYRRQLDQQTRHPIVTVHPETGERALLFGNFAQYIWGFTRSPSNHLFEMIQYYVTLPENTIRWHWEMGDVALWDNRSSQHYGVRDYTARRIMRRISLVGQTPRSINGEPSVIVEARGLQPQSRVSRDAA